ncbi:FadR/GntR family transcriptional regulator [Acidovorax sp. SRB_14]|uniref:FadR/GntR family transcriptional regulator n=1 Tax=Acidovorax sp. SRB_14 TaxID=1962699 RepID=UPI0015669A42|nr:FadR/GntR family transcriptional regulator [Acidovorax sp. SRB_14]
MLKFESVKTKRVSDEIAEQIRRHLASGELEPGDKLPAERELAVHLGVGRNAVREALRLLEMGGIVELRKGTKGGAFVCAGNTTFLSTGLRDLLSLRGVSIEQLTQARVLIEQAVVDAACDAATEEDLAALDAQLQLASQALGRRDFDAKLDALIEYHRVIARATRNPVLVFVMDALMEMMHDYAISIGHDKNDLSIIALREVNAQLYRRDKVKAGRAMAEHLERVKDRYLAYQRNARSSKRAPAAYAAAKAGAM